MKQLWQQMRVKTLDELVGNEAALAELRQVQSGFVMIYGEMGCGKTSTALAFANERFPNLNLEEHQTHCCLGKYFVQCVHANDFDLSDATNTKFLFNMRTPTLIIVDEAQELTLKKQQSRLKMIPPRNDFILILCTTDPGAIESSIRDRCTKIRMSGLPARELPILVKRACEAVGVPYTTELVQAMNRACLNRPRAVFNAVEALSRGQTLAQAVAAQ